jgi:hypothetical protein
MVGGKTACKVAVKPNQPLIKWALGAVKWRGHELNHSYPTSVEVQNAWSYTSTPADIFMM